MRKATIVRDAEVITGADHLVTRLEARIARRDHRARGINAAHQRILADDFAAHASGGQRILEVHARIGVLENHLAGHQIIQRQIGDAALYLIVFIEYSVGFEGAHEVAFTVKS